MLPCPSRLLLGIDCPFCGGQRALLLLLKGDVAGSFLQFPPLLPVLFCALLFALHLVNRKIVAVGRVRVAAIAALAVVLVNYAVKLTAGGGW
ncbi:MAG: DUF2752 domain-containing protein [Chitinophagaceae bacterium]